MGKWYEGRRQGLGWFNTAATTSSSPAESGGWPVYTGSSNSEGLLKCLADFVPFCRNGWSVGLVINRSCVQILLGGKAALQPWVGIYRISGSDWPDIFCYPVTVSAAAG